MTTLTIPARRWGDEPKPEVRPTVIVSSRDGAEVPHVTGAARLAKAAEAAGWAVRQTYAAAFVPGTARRAVHLLASVAVRLARGGVCGAARGFAIWHRVDDGPWKFDSAALIDPSGVRALGAREFARAVSAS
jgi:hypothetical protein